MRAKLGKSSDSAAEGEWRRLIQDPYHSLEFTVTMHCLRKYLPQSGHILDAGGGPGRYSIELCRSGYTVTLLDISPEAIFTAKSKLELEPPEVQQRLRDFVIGDIRNLSRFESERFDAVLCLGGPLTHCAEEADRRRVLRELVRVARPGEIVAISVGGYLALLRTVLMQASDELVDPLCQEFLSRGDNYIRGQVWHFFRAGELRDLAESCGLITLEMAGCEGLSTGLHEATNKLRQDEAKWRRWVELVLETYTEPAVVDMAEHILYVGRVPER